MRYDPATQEVLLADQLSPQAQYAVKAQAMRANAQIERTYFAYLSRYARMTRQLGRLYGAFALGVLSAGLAVFAVMIVLNAIFQYAPPL